MRRGHRKVHRTLWLILTPLLFIALTMALALRPPPKPAPPETYKEAAR